MIRHCLFIAVFLLLTACSSTLTPTPAKVTNNSPAFPTVVGSPTVAVIKPTSTPTTIPRLQPPQQASTTRHLHNGDAFSITQIQMIDQRFGWGIAAADDQNEHLLTTQDGGQTWKDITPPAPVSVAPDHPLHLIAYFLDARNAWVIYDPANEALAVPPPIWHSQDGGRTWQASQPIPPEQMTELSSPLYLYFVDPQVGWLMLGHGAAAGSAPVSIYQTRDGGRNWQRILEMLSAQSGSVDTCCQSGMLFFDDSSGVITTSSGPDPYPHVNWSQDGGKSWQRQDLPLPDRVSQDAACGTHSPRISQTTSLYVIMECQVPDAASSNWLNYLYHTDNYGQTWESVPLPKPDKEPAPWRYNWSDLEIKLVSATDGWLIVRDYYEDEQQTQTLTHLYRTTDGGDAWEYLGKVNWQGSYSFIDIRNGWAVARRGDEFALVFTTDGGATWEIIKTEVKE
jgi:photosystem II stability/assembly factor-like uncharacterized protein